MGQYRQTFKSVTLAAAGGADNARVWDSPCIQPLERFTIFITSFGEVMPAGDLDWVVYYGGKWAGTPFASGSTHSGGVSQGSGTIAGGTEIAHVIYEETAIIPANMPTNSGVLNQLYYSTPLVLYLKNDKASAITLHVAFISLPAGTNL